MDLPQRYLGKSLELPPKSSGLGDGPTGRRASKCCALAARGQPQAGSAGFAVASPLRSDPFSSFAGRTGKELAEQPAENGGTVEVAQRAYYNPDKFRIDPTTLPPAAPAAMAGNRAALAIYGGTSMTDSGLLTRLAEMALPVLVVWGEADQMFDQEYGRAYAAAIPGSKFVLLKNTGHLPQMETPDQLLPVVWDFATSDAPEHPIS